MAARSEYSVMPRFLETRHCAPLFVRKQEQRQFVCQMLDLTTPDSP